MGLFAIAFWIMIGLLLFVGVFDMMDPKISSRVTTDP